MDMSYSLMYGYLDFFLAIMNNAAIGHLCTSLCVNMCFHSSWIPQSGIVGSYVCFTLTKLPIYFPQYLDQFPQETDK